MQFLLFSLGSRDFDSALFLADEYFELVRNKVEGADAELAIFHITVVNNISPVSLFSTEDGTNFTSTSNGKRTEVSLS